MHGLNIFKDMLPKILTSKQLSHDHKLCKLTRYDVRSGFVPSCHFS